MESTVEERISVTVPIINNFGLHARPATKIVQMAVKARGNVFFVMGKEEVDGKSLIDILSLGAVKDSFITIQIDNPDDQSVLDNIVDFFQQGFGER